MLQRGARLLCVSDLLLLGRVTIEEARSLLYWLGTEAGYGKMGVCGLSMGKILTLFLIMMILRSKSFLWGFKIKQYNYVVSICISIISRRHYVCGK